MFSSSGSSFPIYCTIKPHREACYGVYGAHYSLVIAAIHTQDTLGPEQVIALVLQQPAQPLLQLVHVQGALHLNTHTAHAVVVLVLLLRLQMYGR